MASFETQSAHIYIVACRTVTVLPSEVRYYIWGVFDLFLIL